MMVARVGEKQLQIIVARHAWQGCSTLGRRFEPHYGSPARYPHRVYAIQVRLGLVVSALGTPIS